MGIVSELRKSARLEALVPEPKYKKKEKETNPLADAILEAFGITQSDEKLPSVEEILFEASAHRQRR